MQAYLLPTQAPALVARGVVLILIALLLISLPARAGEAIVNLEGRQIQLGEQFLANSAGRLPASRVYEYVLEGSVHGTGVLAESVPAGTSFAELAAAMGGTLPLSGQVQNPTGRLPFSVINQTFARDIPITVPILGTIDVTVTLRLKAAVQANGIVQFSFLATAVPKDIPDLGGLPTPAGSIVFEAGSRLIVRSLFDSFGGEFVGAIEAVPFQSGHQGIAKINVTLGGLMTGSLQFQGGNYRIKTGLGANLRTALVKLGKTGATAQFIADAENLDEITLEIVRPGQSTVVITLKRTAFAAGPPTPRGGTYTVALVPPPLGAGETAANRPFGHGYLVVTVTVAGNVLAIGQLCDGKPLACASALLADETFPFYTPVAGGEGSVFGTLAMEIDTHSNDLDGTLRWMKPATPADRMFKDAFDVNLSAIGSCYTKPLPGLRVLKMLGGEASLSGGNLASPLLAMFTLSQRNVFTFLEPVGLKLKAVTAKGLLQGTFKPAARSKAVKIRGVILQKHNAGSGFFVGNPSAGASVESGRFEISEPPPPAE